MGMGVRGMMGALGVWCEGLTVTPELTFRVILLLECTSLEGTC